MTPERIIFTAWLESYELSEKASGKTHEYLLGKCVGFTESLAAIRGIMFVEANRLLMNWKEES